MLSTSIQVKAWTMCVMHVTALTRTNKHIVLIFGIEGMYDTKGGSWLNSGARLHHISIGMENTKGFYLGHSKCSH
jgi:hypothetical protein